MATHEASRLTRRRLLAAGSLGLAGLSAARSDGADGRHKVKRPRATSGDSLEPDWSERLTVTVGTRKGDLVGTTDKPIQAAVDYVARLGGGTVRIGAETKNVKLLENNIAGFSRAASDLRNA